MSDAETDFGFRRVGAQAKGRLVDRVFGSVADRYDLMNDLMSGGLHRIWKATAVARLMLRAGERVLDIGAGTGDLTRLSARAVGRGGRVVACEPNSAMLGRGRDALTDAGFVANVDYVQARGERLPFRDAVFDAVTVSFGLRNFTDKPAGLAEMYRVLAPGGRVLVLEFSKPVLPQLEKLYEFYSFEVIPWIGERVTGDRAAYRYLVESIRVHPDQAALARMLEHAGFERVRWHNLTAGVVAVHVGYRL